MKIGKRQQQNRDGTKKQKIPCPSCGKYYLETFWGYKDKKFQGKGLYCPNETCNYCAKIMSE